MASITRNHLYTVDLNKPMMRQSCGILLAEGDNKGDCFRFALVRDGVDNALDSTAVVSAYMIRQDGSTVPVNGWYEGNTVSVTLPAACYAKEGHFALAVKVDMNDATTTVAVLDGFIKSISTDTVVDPGAVVPSLEDLLTIVADYERLAAAGSTVNLVNGTGVDSLRQTSAAVEDEDYTIGESAVALGRESKATGIYSRAGGLGSIASGMGAVADGAGCEASGTYSHAMGVGAKAEGRASVAMGFQTVATGLGQLVAGKMNIPDEGNAFIVGNGASQEAQNNAFAVDWNGNGYFAGEAFANGDKKLARLEEVAPPIIPSAAGEFVSITDSADRPLAGLTLCGKTTQNGTPTPNNPVPLVNVGAGGSIIVTVENGGSLTASTPNGLAGIPVTSGGNYMDANGVHWYCDYRDYKNGINVQRVHVLDAASIAWNPNSINHAGDGYIFYTILHGTLSQRDMLSNRFQQNQILSGGSLDVLNVGEATVIIDNGNDFAYVILCMPGNINTEDAINAYFAANPTTFLCVGKAPVITPIPDDEMAAFRAMNTHKPNTTIYNDAGAFMYVDYIADTKTYIDQRIAALLKN